MGDTLIAVGAGVDFDANSVRHAAKVNALFAGDDIDAGAPCYVDSDGLVQMSVKPDEGVPAYVGFAMKATAKGEPIVLFMAGARLTNYAAGMTPGTELFIGDVAGKLTATGATGDRAVAVAISATDIVVIR